jgi:hypothetical protein
MSEILSTSHVYDFCDRTFTIAPDPGFSLDLYSCYPIYSGYCKEVGIEPFTFERFLHDCKIVFPHSFKEYKIAHLDVSSSFYLAGINYTQPQPFKILKNSVRYALDKTTVGHIDKINRRLSNEDLPDGIPEYWPDFARLCKIKSGNKMVFFSPFDYQVEVWELMCKYTQLTIVKSRQLGITQVIISVFLHRACLNPAYTATIFLRNKSDTTKIAARNRQMVQSLSEYITNESDNMNYFKIAGGGDLHFMNNSQEGSRSLDSVSDTLLDEAAFNKNIESIVGGSGASMAMVGDEATQVVVSTPNTKYGWFYDRLNNNNPRGFDFDKVCEQVVNRELPSFYKWEDDEGNCKVILHWRAHPIYGKRDDYVAYRRKVEDITHEQAEREYNLQFVNSAVSIFPVSIIDQCRIGNFELNHNPNENYYMGIDTAGWGQNYTVAFVAKESKVEISTGLVNGYSIVAQYRRNKTMHDQDMLGIAELIRTYQPKRVAVETVEGTGQITFQKLTGMFPSLDVVAVRTTDQNKPVMIARLKTALEEKRLIFPKASALGEELAIFSDIDGKMTAPSGKNDDCVIAAALTLIAAPFNDGDNRVMGKIQPIDPDEDELG